MEDLSLCLAEIINYMFGVDIVLGEYFNGFTIENERIRLCREYLGIGVDEDVVYVIPEPYRKLWSNIQLGIDSVVNAADIINELVPSIFGDTEESEDAEYELESELEALSYLIGRLAVAVDKTGDLTQKMLAYGCPVTARPNIHDTDSSADYATARRFKQKRKYLDELKIVIGFYSESARNSERK